MESIVEKGRYRHYKGGEYEVLCIAKHTETCEEMVIYRALYGEGSLWARPATMWFDKIEKDGFTVTRFTKVN